MADGARAKLRQWFQRRERIYIVPSGRGLTFLVTIVVLVMIGATYNNNLIFILAFIMFSLFLASMVQTHYNMKGVRLHFLGADEAFAGDVVALTLTLGQRRVGRKPGLCVRTGWRQWKCVESIRADLTLEEPLQQIRLVLVPKDRGVHPLPTFVVETFFPIGLFRAWVVFRLPGEVLIYPQPAGDQVAEIRAQNQGEENAGVAVSPEGDFGELKPHREGESYHQIAWKHYARTGQLLTKAHWGDQLRHYVISGEPRGSRLEQELSQMSAWVKQAMEENASLEMTLGGQQVAPASGPDQGRTCWRLLAQYQERS